MNIQALSVTMLKIRCKIILNWTTNLKNGGIVSMSHKINLILGAAFAALVAVISCTTLFAEEPSKLSDSTSVEELRISASNGNADAMLELGERLIPEQGTDSGATEALEWIQKAADAGKTQGYYDLGFIYANNAGVKGGLPAALKYWQTGAEKGNADCQFSVGLLYQAGERIPGGVKADPAEAAKWYKLAADQNQQEAIYHLAQLYLLGDGVKKDLAEAAKWFGKGAEAGNWDAQWSLGESYRVGRGVTQDNIQAYALWVAAIEGVENPDNIKEISDHKKGMSEQLDELRKEMTPEQVEQGKELSKEWIAKRQ
jgi:TPR repeat protein